MKRLASMLHIWHLVLSPGKESDSSNYIFRAPILLVPIQLEQASAVDPYFIKSTEDDVIVNPTFAYKMDAEYE